VRRKGKRGEGLSRRKARVPRRGFRALGYVVRIERQFGVRGAGSPSRVRKRNRGKGRKGDEWRVAVEFALQMGWNPHRTHASSRAALDD